MKKLFLSMLLAVLTVFTVNAQEQKKASTQAEITFTEMEHDYGEVVKGGDGMCEFVYKNTGKAPLMLTNVRSSCGCTIPSWSKEPLMPGKTAKIQVKYNTNNVGTINKSITVESNASNGRVILKIKGKVINK
ncbi:MAG: DUF1573 domain-containing protein [Bacteroidales bacterium]|nr:DUF1573 domain-containing protein [Bacteroidales bacterium]MBQ9311784.1 DUF1573 domain-containing protein [Bacteroidales bacterium]